MIKKKDWSRHLVKRNLEILKILDNSTRRKIIRLCLKRSYSITELSIILGINYQNVSVHLDKLENISVIDRTKQRMVGEPIEITTNKKRYKKIINKLLDRII